MKDKYDEAVFYPKAQDRVSGGMMGTFVREDGATCTGVVSRPQEDESDDGDRVQLRPRGDGTYDARFPVMERGRRGWTSAYDAGWDRIFGGETAEA